MCEQYSQLSKTSEWFLIFLFLLLLPFFTLLVSYFASELHLTLKQLLKRLLTMYRAMGLMQELIDAMLMPM